MCILNSDYSISKDISEFILNDTSNSLSINYQNGIRRTLQITLINDNGQFNPDPNGLIYIRTPFRLDLGIVLSDNSQYFPSDNCGGVFLIQSYEIDHIASKKVIIFNFVDLYSLLDNTLSGTLINDYYIPNGTNLMTAVRGVLNAAGDNQPMIFSPTYSSVIVPYDCRISAGGCYGDILTKIFSLVSANFYYSWQNFVAEDGVADINDQSKASIWDYTTKEYEYLQSQITSDNKNIFNSIQVIGANTSGNIATGTAINNNLLSPLNIYRIGYRNKYITDSVITQNSDAQNRAQYELKKCLVSAISAQIKSTYIPTLDVNKVCTTLSDDYLNYNRQRLLIKSITVPICTNSTLDIVCCNTNELGFSVS